VGKRQKAKGKKQKAKSRWLSSFLPFAFYLLPWSYYPWGVAEARRPAKAEAAGSTPARDAFYSRENWGNRT
jgi:hypothetical protein